MMGCDGRWMMGDGGWVGRGLGNVWDGWAFRR